MPAAGVDLSPTVERCSLGVEQDEIFLCQAEPAHLGGGVVGGGPGEDGGGAVGGGPGEDVPGDGVWDVLVLQFLVGAVGAVGAVPEVVGVAVVPLLEGAGGEAGVGLHHPGVLPGHPRSIDHGVGEAPPAE